MNIEILNVKDLESYKELIDECFGSSNSLEQYKQYQENAAYTIFVVKDGSKVVGSITQYKIELFTFDFQPCLMLFNIAVSADYRKNQIAKHLLNYVIENAKIEGYRSISINCLDTAYPAHKLYESVGFKREGSIKFSMDL